MIIDPEESMKIFFRLAGWCGCLFLLCGCAILDMPSYLPYHGKVLDAETRKPIEGAVALIVSYEYHIFSPNSTFSGANEGVSDKNGEFVVPPLSWFKPNDSETITVIKAGYTSRIFSRSDVYRRPNSPYYKGKLEWEGKNPIVLLRKLTKEEMRKFSVPDFPAEASFEEMKNYLAEIDRIRIAKGLEPRGSWKGKRINYE